MTLLIQPVKLFKNALYKYLILYFTSFIQNTYYQFF